MNTYVTQCLHLLSQSTPPGLLEVASKMRKMWDSRTSCRPLLQSRRRNNAPNSNGIKRTSPKESKAFKSHGPIKQFKAVQNRLIMIDHCFRLGSIGRCWTYLARPYIFIIVLYCSVDFSFYHSFIFHRGPSIGLTDSRKPPWVRVLMRKRRDCDQENKATFQKWPQETSIKACSNSEQWPPPK